MNISEPFFVPSAMDSEIANMSDRSEEKAKKILWAKLLSELEKNGCSKEASHPHNRFIHQLMTNLMQHAQTAKDWMFASQLYKSVELNVHINVKFEKERMEENPKRLWVLPLRYKQEVFDSVCNGQNVPNDYLTEATKLKHALELGNLPLAVKHCNSALLALIRAVKAQTA